MPNHFRGPDESKRFRGDHFHRGGGIRGGPTRADGYSTNSRRMSRSRSPLRDRQRDFYQAPEMGRPLRRSRERTRQSPPKSRVVSTPRHLRMDDGHGARAQSGGGNRERVPERNFLPGRHNERDFDFGKRNPNLGFAELDRAVRKAREEKGSSYWNKKVIEAEERDPNRWGHSGYKELYRPDLKGFHQNQYIRPEFSRRSRSRSLQRKRDFPPRRSRSPRRNEREFLPRRSGSPGPRREQFGLLKSLGGVLRPPSPGEDRKAAHNNGTLRRKGSAGQSRDDTRKRNIPEKHPMTHRDHPEDRRAGQQRTDQSEVRKRNRTPPKPVGERGKFKVIPQQSNSRPNSGRDSTQRKDSGKADIRQSEKNNRNSSISSDEEDDSSRTPSPELKRRNSKSENKEQTRAVTVSKSRSSSSESSSDEDVLEIHARDRRQSLSVSGDSSSDTGSDESVRKPRSRTGNSSSGSSSNSDESEDDKSEQGKPQTRKKIITNRATVKTKQVGGGGPKVTEPNQKGRELEKPKNISPANKAIKPIAGKGKEKSTEKHVVEPSGKKEAQKTDAKSPTKAKATKETKSSTPPTVRKPIASNTKESGTTAATAAAPESESETGSSSDSEEEPRMTLSERFAKLTQMSTDRREFAKPEISIKEIDTKLKVVKDLRNSDTKVFVNQAKRPATRTRPKSPDFVEGEISYSYDDRKRHFERMTRDEPMERDRPDDWSDVRVRYNYYKSRGYFDERPLTLEEYIKWEAWWYDYRDWLEGEGYYDQRRSPPQEQYVGGPERDVRRNNWRPISHQNNDRPLGHGPRPFHHGQQHISPRNPEPLLGRPMRFGGRNDQQQREEFRVPISRRIGHSVGGSLVVNIRQQGNNPGNFRGGGRGRLAGRIGIRR